MPALYNLHLLYFHNDDSDNGDGDDDDDGDGGDDGVQ